MSAPCGSFHALLAIGIFDFASTAFVIRVVDLASAAFAIGVVDLACIMLDSLTFPPTRCGYGMWRQGNNCSVKSKRTFPDFPADSTTTNPHLCLSLRISRNVVTNSKYIPGESCVFQVCVNRFACVCLCAIMCVCMCAYVCLCVCIHVYVCVFVHTRLCECVHMCMCVRACVIECKYM
jgi:hypothetical protein